MRTFFQTILTVTTLAVLVWATWQGYGLLQQQNMGLDTSSQSILIIVGILAIACTFMIAMAISNYGDKTVRAHQFAKRFSLYEKCNVAWLEIQNDFPTDQPVKLDVQLMELEAQIVLLSSTKVIKAFYECQRAASSDGLNTPVSRNARQKLLWAMREDLGQPADYLLQKEIFKNH